MKKLSHEQLTHEVLGREVVVKKRYPVVIQGQRSGREHTRHVIASTADEARRIVTERGSSVVSVGEPKPLTTGSHEVDCFDLEAEDE